jgi:GMP synthase (glutamine-hydrolysing)
MHDDAIVALPPGATWLGSTPMYAHQVFRVGPAAWGVQFHPEVSPATIAAWADAHPVVVRADVEPVFLARDPEVVAAGRALAHRFAGLVRAGARGAGRAPLTA